MLETSSQLIRGMPSGSDLALYPNPASGIALRQKAGPAPTTSHDTMLSNTREHLARLDNQHAFERLAADVLNHLDRSLVEPMAPGGGSDGGIDLLYVDSNGSKGVGFVTLRKDIARKFQSDLKRLGTHDGEISLFCTVDVSPKQRADFLDLASNIGATVLIFDLERLRSLLDTRLQTLRNRYLGLSQDHLRTPQTLASTVETKLLLSHSREFESPTTILRLLASAPPDQLIPVYSVTIYVQEPAKLSTGHLELLDTDAYLECHGRKLFASIYRRVVSPSLGHPIWHGAELDLLGFHTKFDLDLSARWTEVLIASELHAPGLSSPIVNRILITKSQGSIAYHYSHEQDF